MIDARADFLIRREGDAELSVRLLFADDGFQRGHDLRNARLIVRAEQRRAVGGDEGHARQFFECRERGGAELFAAAREQHVAAVIVFDDLRLYVFAGAVRRGIHMGDKAERGLLFTARRRGQPAVDDAVFIDVDIFKTKSLQFFHELMRQIILTHGAGDGCGVRIGRGIDGNIFEQSFICAHGNRSPLIVLDRGIIAGFGSA